MSVETIEQLNKAVAKSRNFATGVIGVFVSVYALWFVGIKDQGLSDSVSDWGVFGDFIGGILNPLIAYLAFYWLTKSIVMQRSELEQARHSFIDQLNMTRKESARVQLQEYMNEEFDRLNTLLQSRFAPFNFVFGDDNTPIGISSFEQLKGLYGISGVQQRADFLRALNSQIRTTYGDIDGDNRQRWTAFNRLLVDIHIHLLTFADYVLMFSKVSEIYGVTNKQLESLTGYIFIAYEIGAISMEEHSNLAEQITAAREESLIRYNQFQMFLANEKFN